MNDDPSDVDVLYAKVYCEPLQEIADQMIRVFVKNGKCPPSVFLFFFYI